MCIGKGMIIRRYQTKPDYDMESNDHQPLIQKLNLQDTKLIDRNFVRIELCPLNSLTSQNPDDWQFEEDEQETLPSWYIEEKEIWKERCLGVLCRKIIPDWIKNGIGASLYLRGTAIKSLGKLQTVGGSLDLRGTAIKSLGKLQTVGGYLDLRGTKIKNIPEKFKDKIIR